MTITEAKETIKRLYEEAKLEVAELGGFGKFKRGEWLLSLIRRSFRNYYERATVDYFQQKYPDLDRDAISEKLIDIASTNAAILGSIVGVVISADEVLTVFTAGEGGIGLPANLAVAFASIAGEAVALVRIQLQMVAELAKLYGAELDPDDPEDILTILAFGFGGSAANLAGKAGVRVGGRLTKRAVQRYVRKDLLAMLKAVGRRIGFKILQRTIIKYAVPFVSMGIGAGWNYIATRKIGGTAKDRFRSRRDGPRGSAAETAAMQT